MRNITFPSTGAVDMENFKRDYFRQGSYLHRKANRTGNTADSREASNFDANNDIEPTGLAKEALDHGNIQQFHYRMALRYDYLARRK